MYNPHNSPEILGAIGAALALLRKTTELVVVVIM